MQFLSINSVILLLQTFLLLILLSVPNTAAADKGRSISVRFPAFSISPGERIIGLKFKTSEGRIHVGCRPNRWTCDQGEGSVHCYALHASYATAISGMLPEMIISHLPEGGGQPSMEASVDFIDSSGKEYSKDIREYELIIK